MPLTPKTIKSNPTADGFSAIIFGDSGAGKTTMLDSLPAGKTLIISIEGGLDVLANDHHFVECVMPSLKTPAIFMDKINSVYQSLRFEDHPYEFVAIDSASEMERYLQYTQCCLASKTTPTLNHIGGAAAVMRKIIMEFRDLKKTSSNKVGRPINPIFIAGSFPLETLRNSDQVVTKRFPMLTKKFSQEICGLVDIVAHFEIDSGQQRILRVNPTSEVMAKTRYHSLKNITQTGADRVNFFEQVVKPVRVEILGKLQKEGQGQAEKPKAEPQQQRKGQSLAERMQSKRS